MLHRAKAEMNGDIYVGEIADILERDYGALNISMKHEPSDRHYFELRFQEPNGEWHQISVFEKNNNYRGGNSVWLEMANFGDAVKILHTVLEIYGGRMVTHKQDYDSDDKWIEVPKKELSPTFR